MGGEMKVAQWHPRYIHTYCCNRCGRFVSNWLVGETTKPTYQSWVIWTPCYRCWADRRRKEG